MNKNDSKALVVIVLGLALFAGQSVSAASANEARSQVVDVCVNKNTNIDLCKKIKEFSDRVAKVSQKLVKQVGLDGDLGVALAGAAQALTQGKVQIKGSIEGVGSGIEISPKEIALVLQWKF